MKNKYELTSFILRSKRRKQILQCLSQKNMTASELAQSTGMYKSHIARAIKELEKEKLIKCLNPDDRSYRFYRITEKGKNIKL